MSKQAKSNFEVGTSKASVHNIIGFEYGFEDGFERDVNSVDLGKTTSSFKVGRTKSNLKSGRVKAMIST